MVEGGAEQRQDGGKDVHGRNLAAGGECQRVGHDLIHLGIPWWDKVIRTLAVYLGLLVLLRIAGKRQLAQMSTLDLVVLLLLSNVVQNAVIGDDVSVWGGALGAVTLVGVDALLNRLALSRPSFARVFDGTDTTLIDDGAKLAREMRHVGIRDGELDHALRLQNGDDATEVQSAVLDASGHLIVTLKPDERSATKGDIERIEAQLARIEAALAAGGSPSR